MSDLLNIQIPLKTVMLPQNSLLYTLNVHIECEQTCVTTDQSHIIIHLGPVEIGGGQLPLPPVLPEKPVPSKDFVLLISPPDF